MAVSLSNNFSLYTSRLFSSSSSTSIQKPSSKSLEFRTLALQSYQHRRPHLLPKQPRFSLPGSSPVSNSSSRNFRSFLSVDDDSTPETSDEEISETDSDQQSSPNLKSLLKLYKEAVLDGDEKTTSDIEVVICALENEKSELVEKVSSLSAEISSGQEKYIRLQADFNNFRRRSDKEKLTVRSNAQGEVIESLLPMVDNFERAKQQLKLETEAEQKIDASYQGIYKQFVEIMRSLHVAVVATVGKPFDPALHEAIAREESEEFNDGIIIQEFRRGFLLGDRLLRPAMVKVSAGPGKSKPSTDEIQESIERPTTAAGLEER